MNAIAALAIGLVVAFGSGIWIGHGWGESARADEVMQLTSQLAACKGERQSALDDAAHNAADLTSLRATLDGERQRLHAIDASNQRELAARADRIAALQRAAAIRKSAIQSKAAADEDCAPLRDLPVCRAVADRLWGAADTHSH